MSIKNKYVIRARISEAKFRQIVRLFSEDLNATQISHLVNLSRPTINKYLTAIRLKILKVSQLQSIPLVGEIEVGESYFGTRRVRGKYGHDALGKTIVFGLLKQDDKVYTKIVPNCSSVTPTKGYQGKNKFARGNSYINGIESFWGYAKTRLVKFKGMNKNTFDLHLKECEFRFNNRKQNLYKILLGIFRKEPLKLSWPFIFQY